MKLPNAGGIDDAEPSRPHPDYRAMLARRFWWLTLPLFVSGVAGVVAARIWPVLYRSEAMVLVEQQKIPEQYVLPNVVANLQYRLDSMTQQILSRTRLQRLVEDFRLFPRERARLTIDELIDRMRALIGVELVPAQGRQNELTAFKLSFSYETPAFAQRIANELTSLFIEENLRARTQQSQSTTNFLRAQLEEAHQMLLRQETRQREFKSRYLGELPQQEQSSLQILSSLESQLQIGAAALERAEQQKIYLEALKAQYESLKTAGNGPGGAGPGADPALAAAQSKLNEERSKLAESQAKYTADHPDVIVQQAIVADAEAQVESLKRLAAGPGSQGTPPVRNGPANSSLIEVTSRLEALEREIPTRKADMDKIDRRIRDLQKHLSLTPVREQELAEVTRNYENSRAYYQSLLEKKLGSELATNLEKRQQGEQFRILDPASLPQKPYSPNRLQIVALGWIAGLCAGMGLTLLREMTDRPLRTAKDIAARTKAPVIARIPVLRTRAEQGRQTWMNLMKAAWAGLLILLCAASSVQVYLRG